MLTYNHPEKTISHQLRRLIERMNKVRRGRAGEAVARMYLEDNNFKVIKYNYFTRYGELDIIALNKNRISFIEVKTYHNQMIHPLYSITPTKQRHMWKTANYFLLRHKQYRQLSYQFDIILVKYGQVTDHLKNVQLQG